MHYSGGGMSISGSPSKIIVDGNVVDLHKTAGYSFIKKKSTVLICYSQLTV